LLAGFSKASSRKFSWQASHTTTAGPESINVTGRTKPKSQPVARKVGVRGRVTEATVPTFDDSNGPWSNTNVSCFWSF